MKAIVNIGLKQGVLDPAGKAVHHALNSLHFDSVGSVRIGKQIVIELDESDSKKAEADVVKMCEELLANTVIEDYTIEIQA
jgi:phosphoribosylformylglycinamidine synthase